MLLKVINFLKTGIWQISLKNYSRRKSFFLRQLRIIVLAVRGFAEDKCKFRASALTFYSSAFRCSGNCDDVWNSKGIRP